MLSSALSGSWTTLLSSVEFLSFSSQTGVLFVAIFDARTFTKGLRKDIASKSWYLGSSSVPDPDFFQRSPIART